MVSKKLVIIMFLLTLAPSLWGRDGVGLDTLHVITPDGTGHISMTEQPCTIEWQGQVYNNVMVRGRGHTFNAYPDKQPMRLRFKKRVPLLTYPEGEKLISLPSGRVGEGALGAKKWTILAMNDDPTLMRDAVAWFIADRMGMEYVPAHQYAVVVIDNRPQGICLIADQVEVGPYRVPVRQGGFLAELDGYADGRFFYTAKHHLPVRIHYPDDYGDEFDETADRIITFEENLKAPHLTSPEEDLISLPSGRVGEGASLIPWYLTAELIANPDAYWSLYFYARDAHDTIHFGPIWDSGKAFGNDRRFTDTEHRRLHTFAFNAAWGLALATDQQFNNSVAQRWQSLDRQRLLQDIEAYITHLESLLHTDGTPIRHFLCARFTYLNTVLTQSNFVHYSQ